MYEYTSEVFAVGLDGFAPVDNKKLSAMAADGWEPAHMTTVHNGFAAMVLFRREAGTGRRTTAPAAGTRVRKAPATKKGATKAAPARKKASAAKATGRRSSR
jgi:hypothetical protein